MLRVLHLRGKALLIEAGLAPPTNKSGVKGKPMTFETMSWSLAEGEYEGHITSTRFAHVPRDFPRARYPIHLNITWTMYEPDEYGLSL